MKRNRVGTEEELTLLDDTQPPMPRPNQPKVEERAEESNPLKLGQFLERCHYCKKYMPEGVEVFMYRDFCGFCSVGCRDIQISLDKLAAKQVKLAEKQVASCKGMEDQLAEKQVASCKGMEDQCKGSADVKSQFSYK